MMTFSSISDNFLKELGYTIKYCSSEEEARKFAYEMKEGSKTYPVYYFTSDTTGEKGFEEFFVPGEKLNMERFSSLGIIENYPIRPVSDIDKFFTDMNILLSSNHVKKSDIVKVLKDFIPNFEHEEKGKNLDSKM